MSTLSGNTIANTYPSLLRFDNFTGSPTGTTAFSIVDGLGQRTPLSISQQAIKFSDSVDFTSAAVVDFDGSVMSVAGTDIDFSTTNTTGMTKNVAVKTSGGRQPAIDGQISYSGGTGINITQDAITNTFTWEVTGATSSENQIIYAGSGITTTEGRAVYWDGTDWAVSPTSSNAYNKLIGITNGTNTLTDGVIIGGFVRKAAQTGYTAGDLYLPSVAGGFSETPNYTNGEYIRGIGHSLGSLGIVLNPDIRWEYNNNTSYLITNSDEVLITNDGFALAYE